MKRAGWYIGAVIGLAITYVAIVVASPIWALVVCWRQWKAMQIDNVYFVDFKRGT